MDIKSLREEFSTLKDSATKLVEKVASEKRDFSAEEQADYDKNVARLKQIEKHIEAHKQLAETAFSAKESVELPSEPVGKAEVEIVVRDRFDAKKVSRQEFSKAFTSWAKTGEMPRQFATITTASQNNILLPVDVDAPILPTAKNTIREALDVYGLQPMKTPTTATFNVPVATANAGGKVAENASSETENEPGLTESFPLAVSTYQSGSSWFSNKSLLAVDYDLMSAMLPELAYQKELALESDIFSTIAGDSNVTQSVATSTVSAFTYQNLVSLNRKLPKRFNAMKFIVLSKDAYTAAENLTTTTGYPILNALDPQNSSLKYFNGTPVLWSDYLSTFGANNVVGVVISHMGFKLRDAAQEQVQRYTQYPGRPAQTGFNLYGFHGFGYSPVAVATLKCPAS